MDQTMVPIMGPHTDHVAGLWETHEWFFKFLHVQQMIREYLLSFMFVPIIHNVVWGIVLIRFVLVFF